MTHMLNHRWLYKHIRVSIPDKLFYVIKADLNCLIIKLICRLISYFYIRFVKQLIPQIFPELATSVNKEKFCTTGNLAISVATQSWWQRVAAVSVVVSIRKTKSRLYFKNFFYHFIIAAYYLDLLTKVNYSTLLQFDVLFHPTIF